MSKTHITMSTAEFKKFQRTIIITLISVLLPFALAVGSAMVYDHFRIKTQQTALDEVKSDKEYIFKQINEQNKCQATNEARIISIEKGMEKKVEKDVLEQVLRQLDRIEKKIDQN